MGNCITHDQLLELYKKKKECNYLDIDYGTEYSSPQNEPYHVGAKVFSAMRNKEKLDSFLESLSANGLYPLPPSIVSLSLAEVNNEKDKKICPTDNESLAGKDSKYEGGISLFFSTHLVEEKGKETSLTDIYDCYLAFCESYSLAHGALSKAVFSKRLKAKFPRYHTKRKIFFEDLALKNWSISKKVEAEEKAGRIAFGPRIREEVWLAQFDKVKGHCMCCKKELSILSDSWECSHIKALAGDERGDNSIANLLPCCSKCNKSMGTMNLYDYRRVAYGTLWK